MELSQIIIGQILTEKTERLKAGKKRTHTIHVNDRATKIDIKNALKRFYDVDAASVRIIRTVPKTRSFGRGKTMEKRHRFKKALVTLAPKSKDLDIATFKA